MGAERPARRPRRGLTPCPFSELLPGRRPSRRDVEAGPSAGGRGRGSRGLMGAAASADTAGSARCQLYFRLVRAAGPAVRG